MADENDLLARLRLPRFPRAAGYDPQWIMDNQMGPDPLWLAEWLWPAVDLPPGSRVLDLGCGKALTSIFLSREYGLRVVAADLWIPPGDNWQRIQAAGCADSVLPVRTEAHDLRFAEGYFDAVVSIDAYDYFGTADSYLPYLARFVRPGGAVAITGVGLTAELAELPDHLLPYWRPDFWQWKSAAWWRRHWERSGVADVEVADQLEEGWRLWLLWEEARLGLDPNASPDVAEMLRADAGRHLGFVRAAGRTG